MRCNLTLSSFIHGACQNFHFHALFAAGKSSLLISGFPAHLTSFPFHPSSLASNACHEVRMRLLLVIWYILFCSPRTCVTNSESDLCLDLYFTHILFSCFRLTGHLVFSHFNWAVWISSFFFFTFCIQVVEQDQLDGATASGGTEGAEFEQRAEQLHEGYRALMDRYRRLKQMAPTPELEKETDNLVRVRDIRVFAAE